jgi:type I restriction enzyme M protein
MLDTETKRRIDTARDILVGKVPDPKSQVEQITIALIYKFMDDMDREAEELGGERTFFSGEFEKFAWNKIFDPKIGGHELLSLYGEALLKLNINPNIPQLFRDIFKNAYLPYRDPETLKAFLKVIDEFTYDHSEKLGDAFEYLLSVLGSQGSAGQFRTPRHIIDFMVEIIAPKKDETILDPACGTAGFLISSYKHILKHNSSNFDPDKDKTLSEMKVESLSELTLNSKKYKGDKLTPDERARLANNITGYDISPDMIRLSLVNMYLHGLNDPDIVEYDTLTSEDNWNKYANVILANPPFMSPKGGIRPHNRFTVKSNRSEVLFVDYMAEHLTPNGRAAIIVPEGIIFQSGTAYKQLRKMLVDDYLVGVISLPAGVFNPYSGVKTSIIWLDKTLAKKTNNILFVKIAADGFDLGAQRRPIKENSLPEALKQIGTYKQALLKGNEMDMEAIPNFSLVDISKIAANGDYNLSGDRYKIDKGFKINKYDLVKLCNICDVRDGTHDSPKYVSNGYPLITSKNIKNGQINFEEINYITETDYININKRSGVDDGDIIMPMIGTIGNPIVVKKDREFAIKNVALIKFYQDSKINRFFLKEILASDYFERQYKNSSSGSTQKFISLTFIRNLQIPLPPLSVQQEIVSEIEGYQKIIDGARMVVENYKPQIKIDPEWEMVELGEIADITSSKRIFQEEYVNEGIPFYRTKEIVELNQDQPISLELFISEKRYGEISEKFDIPRKGDILLSAVGTIGISWVVSDDRKFYFKDGNLLWIKNIRNAEPDYLKMALDFILPTELNKMTYGAAYKALTIIKLKELKIPIPPIDVQNQIIKSIDHEKNLVTSNKMLIEIYEQKIKDRIAEVWGEKNK